MLSSTNIINKLRGVFFLTIVICICVLVLNNCVTINHHNMDVIMSFAVNGCIIIPNLIKKNMHGYSIEEMIWTFMFLFMFMAPIVQYCTNVFPWENSTNITNDIVFRANVTIQFFILVFMGCNVFFKSVLNKKKNKTVFYYKNIKLMMDISFFASVAVSLFYIKNVGFNNLFTRSTNNYNSDNISVAQIFNSLCCALPALSLSFQIYYKRIKGYIYNNLELIISLILTVLVNFPTGRPRYQCAVIYIGLLILFKKTFSNKYIFKLLIIFGMILLFPILNFFRYNTYDNVSQLAQYKINFSQDLLKGDYDSFSMLCRTIIYKDTYGIQFGYQIIGNIFFFIPRMLWPDKPIGSGAMMAEKFGWSFTNVSCPYIGEGYINFGLLGVVLFAVFLSYISIFLQNEYDNDLINNKSEFKMVNVIYPFVLGFTFFIMRGDMLSSISYLLGFCVFAVVLCFIDIVIRNIRTVK